MKQHLIGIWLCGLLLSPPLASSVPATMVVQSTSASSLQAPISAEAKQHHLRAGELFDDKKFSEALAEIQKALAVSPNYVNAYRRYVQIRMALDAGDAKIKSEFQKKMRQEPKNPIFPLVMAMEQLVDGGSQAEIERLYHIVVELAPDWAWGQYALGWLHQYFQIDQAQAIAAYRKAVQLDAETLTFKQQLGLLLKETRQYDEAIDLFKEMVRLSPRGEYTSYLNLWGTQLAKSNTPETKKQIESEFNELRKREPKTPRWFEFVQNTYLFVLDDREKASRVLAESIKRFPDRFKLQGKGVLSMESLTVGEFRDYAYSETQAPILQKILEAEHIEALPKRTAALEALATEKMEGDVQLYYLKILFDLYLTGYNIEKLEPTGRKLLEIVPGNKQILEDMVSELSEKKASPERVLPYAQQLLEATKTFVCKTPPAGTPPLIIEKFFTEEKQREQYRFERAGNLDTVGWLKYRLGKYSEAEPVLRESVSVKENGKNLLHLGLTLNKLNQPQEAAQMLARASSLDDEVVVKAQPVLQAIQRRHPKIKIKTLLAEAEARQTEKERAEIAKSFVNEPIKDFELVSLSGKRYKLSELHGKVVLINFWASW